MSLVIDDTTQRESDFLSNQLPHDAIWRLIATGLPRPGHGLVINAYESGRWELSDNA